MNGQTPPVPPQQHPADTQSVQLSRASAARTEQVVRWVERNYRLPPPRGGAGPQASLVPAYVGLTTTTITARSGTAYGTGSFKFQLDTGTALADDTTTTYTAKNLLNKTVATAAYVFVVRAAGQWWVVAVGDCANLS